MYDKGVKISGETFWGWGDVRSPVPEQDFLECLNVFLCVCIHACVHIYIYIYTCVYMCGTSMTSFCSFVQVCDVEARRFFTDSSLLIPIYLKSCSSLHRMLRACGLKTSGPSWAFMRAWAQTVLNTRNPVLLTSYLSPP